MSMTDAVRAHLLEWRQARKLTQNELANAIGCSDAIISKLENLKGTALPSLPIALKVARTLGISVEQLVKMPEEAHKEISDQSLLIFYDEWQLLQKLAPKHKQWLHYFVNFLLNNPEV